VYPCIVNEFLFVFRQNTILLCTRMHNIITYLMYVCCSCGRKKSARGRDRFRLAPVWLARAVTPGSTNGDARICEKRFLDRCFLTIFFYSTCLFFFFFTTFYFSSPSSRRIDLPIPHYTTILYRVHCSPAAAASLCRIRPIPNPLPFGNRYDSAAAAALSTSALSVVSRWKSALGPHDATQF